MPKAKSTPKDTTVTLEGSIATKLIQGANGEFTVGTFKTNVGIFKIKSGQLDQFPDEGEYDVSVVVNEFKLNMYPSRRTGICVSEILLEVDKIIVFDFVQEHSIDDPVEPDASVQAIKESEPQQKSEHQKDKIRLTMPSAEKPCNKPKGTSGGRTTANANGDSDEDGRKLFGELWPLPESFRLDTTLPRGTIIKQRDYISGLYQINPTTQVWTRK